MPKRNNNSKKMEDPTGIREIYNKLTDIPSRLKFFIDYKKRLAAANELGVEVSDAEKNLVDVLEDEFLEKYIEKGDPDTMQRVFEALGSLKAESNYRSYQEYSKFMSELPANDPDREKKAKWLLDQTSFGIENFAINDMIRSVKMIVDSKDDLSVDLFKRANLSEDTTMEEFALKAGVRKSDIPAFLKDQNTSAGTKMVDFFKRKYPRSNKIASKIAEDLAMINTRKWLENASVDRIGSKNLSKKQFDELMKVGAMNNTTVSFTAIDDWIKKTGKRYIRFYREPGLEEAERNFLERYKDGREECPDDVVRQNEGFRKKYNSLTTIEEKLNFLSDLLVYDDSRKHRYGDSLTFGGIASELLEKFVEEHITKGTAETCEETLACIGRLTTEYLLKLREDDEKLREQYKSERKTGTTKADYLSQYTRYGIYLSKLRGISNKCSAALVKSDCDARMELCERNGIGENTTIAQFAEKIGYTGEKAAKYINDYHASPDDKMIDVLKAVNNTTNNAAAMIELRDEFVRQYTNHIKSQAGRGVLDNAGLDQEKLKHFQEVAESNSGEYSKNGIEAWIKGEGDRVIEGLHLNTARTFINDFTKGQDKSTGYDQYIRLHTGDEVIRSSEEKRVECLSKALAASVLKMIDSKFDKKEIRLLADKIRTNKDFIEKVKDADTVTNALTDAESVEAFRNEIYVRKFNIVQGSGAKYVEHMNALLGKMLPPEGRSREYKAFYNALKKIGDLKGAYDETDPADRAARDKLVGELNVSLFYSAQEYMRGKEKVRSTENGKTRFNNALDAIAVMSVFAPDMKNAAERIATRINTKRNVKEGSEKFVRLSDHVAEGVELVVAPEAEIEEVQQEEVKEEPKVEIKEELKVEAKEEPKVEIKEEPKVEVKEEPKVEIKEEPKPEVKEEPKVEVKEEPKPEVKEEPKDEIKEEPKKAPEKKKEKKNKGILERTDEALERIKKGEYKNGRDDKQYREDALYALIGQMVRITGGAALTNRNTGEKITFKEYSGICIDDGIMYSLMGEDQKMRPFADMYNRLTSNRYIWNMALAGAKPDKGVKVPEVPALKGADAVKYMLGFFAKDLMKAGEDLAGIYEDDKMSAGSEKEKIQAMMKLSPQEFREKLHTIIGKVDEYLDSHKLPEDAAGVERNMKLSSFKRKMADYLRELEAVEKGGTNFVHAPKIGMKTEGEKISYPDLKKNLLMFTYDMAEKANEGKSFLTRYDPESFIPELYGAEKRPDKPDDKLADVFTAMKDYRALFMVDKNGKVPPVSFDIIKDKVTKLYKAVTIYRSSIQNKKVDEAIALSIDALQDTCSDQLRNIDFLQPYMDMETAEGRIGGKNIYDVTKTMEVPYKDTRIIATEDYMIKPQFLTPKENKLAKQVWVKSKDAFGKEKNMFQKSINKSVQLRTKFYIENIGLSDNKMFTEPADNDLSKKDRDYRKKNMMSIAATDIFIKLADDANMWMELNSLGDHGDTMDIVFSEMAPKALEENPAFLNVHENATYSDIAEKVMAEAKKLGTLEQLKAELSPKKVIETVKAKLNKTAEVKAEEKPVVKAPV